LSTLIDTDELEALIVHLAAQYEQGIPCRDLDGELVSDPEYDTLVRQLRDAKPDAEILKTISPAAHAPGQTDDAGVKMVIHDPPMTSIAKADTEKREAIYQRWLEECCTTPVEFAHSYKLDGVALSIRYENGRLVSAGLRPRDGVRGTDVTANVKYVRGIPQRLSPPLTLTLRGEVICTKEDFARVQANHAAAGEPLKANERNHAFGAIRQLTDPSKTALGLLSFMAYGIVKFDQWRDHYRTEIERAKWARERLLPDGNFVLVHPHGRKELELMEAGAADLPFRVDGVILKVNDLEAQAALGHHGDDPTGDPRGALAWKFLAEEATAVVKSISYEASRTGRITLVANFDGVPLAGTTVRRATCNNIGWAEKMGIGPGATVVFIKGGEIIPKIVRVADGRVEKNVYPRHCPSCRYHVSIHVNGDKKDLRCGNPGCPAKHIKGFVHFLTKLECKGLGESAIEMLVRAGHLREWVDLITLTTEQCVAAGFSYREALLALATIHKVKPVKDNEKLAAAIATARNKEKKVPAWQFFAALGIPQCGETVGKLLVAHFSTVGEIFNATKEQLLQVTGIGETSADNIVKFIETYRLQISTLMCHFELEMPQGGKLAGINFCLSGGFTKGKEYWEALIAAAGGNCTSSVGKKTTYLVAGPGSGLKSEKARELNIPIIDVNKLEEMLA
jgi:DNA ligase (NAD+)